MELSAEILNKPGVEVNLDFISLPAYASYLLQHKVEDFAAMNLKFSKQERVPLLKFLEHLAEAELLALAIHSSKEFLTCIAANNATAFITKSTSDFIKNRIPAIDREQVMSEDITKVSFVRRKTLRHFLTGYTMDLDVFSNVMEEVDRFVMESESAAFNAYIDIQQDKITRINQELERRHFDLLEAQELAQMGSFQWDLKHHKSILTPGAYKIFDLVEVGNMGSFMQDVHEEDRSKVETAINKAFTRDGLYECEYRYKRNDQEKNIWSRGLVSYENGEPVSMKGTIMDVTQKNRLLDQLQQSEALHKQAQSITHIGNWTWNIVTNEVNWSDEMYRIYGLEPQSEKITFKRFISLLHPDDREKRIKEIQESLQTLVAKDYLLRIVQPGNIIKFLRGKGEVITDKNNKPVKLVGTCQDITGEYLLNKNLQEKEAYLQQLINNAPDAIIVIDSDNIITLWNPKTETIFGWKEIEVAGKELTEVIVPAQHRDAHKAGMKRLMETGVGTILNKTLELTAITKSRGEIDISLTVSQSVQDGKHSFIAFLRDISKEKQVQAELKQKTTELERANETLNTKNNELQIINSELESFNYIASHDLKEPLRKIQVFTDRLLEKKAGLEPVFVDYLGKVVKSAARMQFLIEDLLLYSQSTNNESSYETVDLNQVLAEVKITLSANIEEKNAVIQSTILPEIWAIPFQMQQLLLNLLSNSLKYARKDVSPYIVVTAKEMTMQVSRAARTRYLELSVKDNGIGFEAQNADKIFGLFQRLHSKEAYPGTGIGLAICKKIVNNHKGTIKAESKPLEGTLFKVYLPVSKTTLPGNIA